MKTNLTAQIILYPLATDELHIYLYFLFYPQAKTDEHTLQTFTNCDQNEKSCLQTHSVQQILMNA